MYLREDNLIESGALEMALQEATGRFQSLSDEIKEMESRINDNKVLQQHTNYARTKDIYSQYRKSRHKDKFMEAHRAEVLKHEAAKRAFNAMGIRNLPKTAELKTELAALQDGKKAVYADYRAERKRMQELQAAKNNMDSIAKEQAKGKKKQREL